MFGTGALNARIARLESQVQAQGEALNAMAERLGMAPVMVDPMRLDAEELRLVQGGKAIAAIKHHRERTGSSLVQSKDAVDRARRP
ncbi:MAG: hypothetical protein ABIS84_05225 [Arachnia sp.]